MLIGTSLWNSIRDSFSYQEKVALRACIVTETVCPPGWYIDSNKLPKELLDKLYAVQRTLYAK